MLYHMNNAGFDKGFITEITGDKDWILGSVGMWADTYVFCRHCLYIVGSTGKTHGKDCPHVTNIPPKALLNTTIFLSNRNYEI